MKKVLIPILCIALFGCRNDSMTDLINSTNSQITALETSLPDTCKTATVKSQINAIKSQISIIQKTCDTDKREIKLQRDKFAIAFFLMLFVIGFYFAKRFFYV